MEQFFQSDWDLFLFLNNLGTEALDPIMLAITNEFTFVPLYTLLLYLIYRKQGAKPLILVVLVTVLMITFTDQLTNVVKHYFERPRPCRQPGVMETARFIAERCGPFGFFSGHSSNSMAAAIFGGLILRPYYKKLIYILVVWSIIVGYSRIYVGVHYPTDLLFGFLFGALSGFAFYKLDVFLKKQFIDA